jgi:hypothetical protein
MQKETKTCQSCQQSFTIESDDFSFYEKIKVPPPTFCPECRRQRRLSWRNDYVFYNRKCDLCKREIISIYSPDNPQVIYCNKCWWSDNWDPKSYGRDLDFSKPFFEQFKEFRQKVPALALFNDNNIGSLNCEYTQDLAFGKNCYMCMVAWKLQDCMYFSYGANAKEVVDSMGIFSKSEGLYEALYSGKCFGSKYIQNCESSVNCFFCYDCRGCQDCFMSVGLRNKKYYFKNKQYKKDEYEKIINDYSLNSYNGVEKAKKEFEDFKLSKPIKYAHFINCLKCSGNNIMYSKNSQFNFHANKSENSKFLENGDGQKDSYDLSVGGELSECYESLTPDHSSRALFCIYTWKCMNILYSESCQASNNCFACVALKHGEYSILNKQYSKEEYFELREKIIDHMKKNGEYGEFFPMSSSPFAYNESVAMISFPLIKDEVLEKGLYWQDNVQQTKGRTTLRELPDKIEEINDSILNEILECNSCQRNYKIVIDELTFYRKWKIPIPRICFFCRLQKRFELRGPSKLWHRKCMKPNCNNEFETAYAPKRPEIVYCETCYQKEIY